MNLLTEEMRYKLFHLWMGAALGSGLTFFSGGCAASGQCPTCGACVARLPILALPVLADGAVMLVGHVQRAVEEKRNLIEKKGEGSPLICTKLHENLLLRDD